MKLSELSSFFDESLFIPEMKAKDKKSALKELIQPLMKNNKIASPGLVFETLMKRETLGSTGLGKGVAVPHCRTLAVTEVNVVVGFSDKGIDFEAIDKKKVHIFFLIIAPPQEDKNLYLPFLGKVVELVRDTKTRKALLKINDYSAFLEIIQGG